MADEQAVPIGATDFDPGWHEGVSMARYLGDRAVSASKLWKLQEETPAHLLHELQERAKGEYDDSSAAKRLGSITHTAVFEPEVFGDRYVVLGDCAGVTNSGNPCRYSGSVWRDGQSFCKTHDPAKGQPEDPDVHTIQAKDRDAARGMTSALHRHPRAGAIISAPGVREAVGIWRDPVTGLWCRIRPDLLIQEPPEVDPEYHHSVVNLKTTGKSAAPDEYRFPRDAHFQGHYFKAAFYRMGVRELWGYEPQHFFYPVVETDPPHAVIVYRMDENSLDIGEAEVRHQLNRLAECVETGEWPAYGDDIWNLSLPEWRLKQASSVDFFEVDIAADEREVA